MDTAVEAFKLVLISHDLRGAKASEFAKVCLRIAWMHRYKGDEEEETRFIRYALEHYKQAYEKEPFPADKLDENTCEYIIGELSFRVGEYSEAVKCSAGSSVPRKQGKTCAHRGSKGAVSTGQGKVEMTRSYGNREITIQCFEKLVFSKIQKVHDEILVSPGIGLDCSAIDFGEYACILSCDPITGTAKEIGRLAVHINCNDIASCGVPIALPLYCALKIPPRKSLNDHRPVRRSCQVHKRRYPRRAYGNNERGQQVRHIVHCGRKMPQGQDHKRRRRQGR